MATTTIHANGSKWAGQAPDTIEELIEVMRTEPLDPRFKPYADNEGQGVVRFLGNFLRVSHVFNITTDDPEVCARLYRAIDDNPRD
jgi:hypothetical protein